MKKLHVLFIAVILLPAFLHAETLQIGADHWAPWIIKDKNSYTGIVVEVCREAIKRAGHQCVIFPIPQKRRDLLEWGKSVDVEPGCERAWRVDHENVSVYTIPYIQTRNVVVSPQKTYPAVNTIKTFYGKNVGCNAGYYYTDGFSNAFDEGLIIRDDCGTGHNLILKLIKKRFTAALVDTYEWKYWMKQLGEDRSKYEESYKFSHMNNLRIRLHISKKHLVSSLNTALETMKSDHSIESIVRHFMADRS